MIWLVIMAILLLMAALAVFLWLAVKRQNADRYSAIGTCLAAAATISAFFFLGYQIKLQTDAFQLEHRPYLYLSFDPVGMGQDEPKREFWFGGGNLRFRNVGKDPASIIKTEYMVASDAIGVVPFREWFEKEFGGFPDITNVFPGQEDAAVPCHPIIGSSKRKPKLLYIGAVVSYTGSSSNIVHWYKFSQVFVVSFPKEGRDKGSAERPITIALKPDHEWDRNREDPAPKLKEPDWQAYLSRGYIKTLTSENE